MQGPTKGAGRMENQLLDRDWRFICDSIYRINESATVEELQREALECLLALVHCSHGVFFIANAQGSNLSFGRPVSAGEEARFVDEFLSGGYEKDPYFRGTGSINKTETFRDSDLMPEEYRMSTRLYQEIYKRQGVHFALRSYLVRDGRMVGHVALFRSREQGDFSVKDFRILDALAPHLEQRLAFLLGEERVVEEGRTKAEPLGHALQDAYGVTSREAETALKARDGLSDREISSMLGVSLSTVKKHLHNVYRKTGVGSRVQLAALLNDLLEK